MFRVGLNPYGLSCTVGLQAHVTPPFPEPLGINGFLSLAGEIGAKCVELDCRWLKPMSAEDLARLGAAIAESGMTAICSDWLIQQEHETLEAAIRCTALVGAPTLRLHLTPVLEGARSYHWARWREMVGHARATLKAEARRAADDGVLLAVENHQDFTSEELIAIADEAGPNVGLVLDTGNPFAVGEDPIAFARRAAHHIRHVHLKDYVAHFTTDGYRLIRCAIGDGCVPFQELEAALDGDVTASIEPGALESRHIRLFLPEWWRGYPPREASELATALGRLRRRRMPDDADWRTPWEQHASAETVVRYEMDQLRRSVHNLRALGWM